MLYLTNTRHSNASPEQVQTEPSVQRVTSNSARRTADLGTEAVVGYSDRTVSSVKKLGILQLVLGICVIALQSVTVAFELHLASSVAKLKLSHNYWYHCGYGEYPCDQYGGGIWFGTLVAITAIIGITSAKTQKRTWIVMSIVANMISLSISFAPIVLLSLAISDLTSCTRDGDSFSRSSLGRPGSYYYHRYGETTTTTTTTTPPPLNFFGEKFAGYRNKFYCSHPMFTAWIIIDAFALLCVSILCLLTLRMLIYNFNTECRSRSCSGYKPQCGKCRCVCDGGRCFCYAGAVTDNDAIPLAYFAHSLDQMVAMNDNLFQHPMAAQALARAASSNTVEQKAATDATSGEKWEQLPPAYNEA